MSSDDELEGFDPTTPAAVKKKGPPRGAPRQAKAAVAGPSRTIGGATAKKGAKTTLETNNEGTSKTLDVVVLSSDEDRREKDTAAKGKGKEPAVNGKVAPQLNGKSKAKGKPKSISPPQPMEVDSVPPAEDAVPPTRTSRTTRTNVKPTSEIDNSPPAKRHKADSALEAENVRLRRRLEDVAAQRDRLSEQLKEALQIRATEPERLLAEGIAQYEVSMQTQQQLLQEQAASLARFKALPDSGQLHTLQFITRDVAAEESKGLTERMKKLEQTIKEKNLRVSELETKNEELEKQLEAEIQMAKEYRAKNPPESRVTVNGTVRGTNGSSAPPDTSVVKLYEDLCNFLVTKVVPGNAVYPSFPDLQEKTFHCTYTHIEPNLKRRVNPSLNFTLRHMWLPRDEGSAPSALTKKDLTEKMEYIPADLENESEDFVEHLEFFKTAFIFERNQLHVFMTSLSDRLSELVDSDSGEEDKLNSPPC
ncbi:hypothetical protein BC835DRAFT_491929 [Cytidiella melzeri]|nr:hypothetical protein BC835DRAFT_491929 [Cytidiella melzeri]